MNLITLDYDCLGILADLLCDDLNSLYFFDKYNLKPKGKSVDYSNVDWNESSANENISFEIIHQFPDKLNFEILTNTFKNSNNFGSFCEEYVDKISWNDVCSNMRLTKLFYEDKAKFSHKFKDYIIWDKVSRFAGLDEGYICECADYLDWDIISGNIGLTPYLIERFHEKINFEKLRYNHYVDNSLFEHYLEIDNEDNDIDIDNNIEDIDIEDNDNDIDMSELENNNIEYIPLPIEDTDEDEDIEIIIQ